MPGGSRAPTAQCHPPLTHSHTLTLVPLLSPAWGLSLPAVAAQPARRAAASGLAVPLAQQLCSGPPHPSTAVPPPPADSTPPSSPQPHCSPSRCRCCRHCMALPPLQSLLLPVHSPWHTLPSTPAAPSSGCSRGTPPPWASPQSPRSGRCQGLRGFRPPLPPLSPPFVPHTYLRASHSHQRSLRGSHVH